jgi:hypothetical protein
MAMRLLSSTGQGETLAGEYLRTAVPVDAPGATVAEHAMATKRIQNA